MQSVDGKEHISIQSNTKLTNQLSIWYYWNKNYPGHPGSPTKWKITAKTDHNVDCI